LIKLESKYIFAIYYRQNGLLIVNIRFLAEPPRNLIILHNYVGLRLRTGQFGKIDFRFFFLKPHQIKAKKQKKKKCFFFIDMAKKLQKGFLDLISLT
jgi:hypothetical protein